MNNDAVNQLIKQLKKIQDEFYMTFGVTDIITNSKIFEILIADSLDHDLIPGHSGSRDAKDKDGEYEYKHYKETSSNHTWTFNDFTESTISKLRIINSVIFAHIQDKNSKFPTFDWYYKVPGSTMADYLDRATQKIENNRKMINVSPNQIEEKLGLTKIKADVTKVGRYHPWVEKIIDITEKIEGEVGTTGILTSNKFWEVLVALQLGHKVKTEQAKYDAEDTEGNCYEYKVSKGTSWSFQDISSDVLIKYLSDKSIILATTDKDNFIVKNIFEADAKKIVTLLRQKLRQKEQRYKRMGKEIRRKQISLSKASLRLVGAKQII